MDISTHLQEHAVLGVTTPTPATTGSETYWKRTGDVLSPNTPGDDVSLGLGDVSSSGITCGNVTFIKGSMSVSSKPGDYVGHTVVLYSAETQGVGDAVQIDTNGNAHIAKADAIANASAVLLAATVVTGTANNSYLLPGGVLKLSSSPSWTRGGLIFLSTTGTTGNTLTQTAPSATDNVVQVLGIAIGADTILFMPNLTEVEHT